MARDFEDYDERMSRLVRFWVIFGVIIIFVLIAFFGSWYTVGAGEKAVLLTWGSPNPNAMGSGLHFKIPLVQSKVIMNVQTQKYEAQKASAASQDLQTVTTDVTVNYHILPSNVVLIYTNIGENYQDVIIQPAVQEVVKSITAQYTAEELITKRPEVKDKIDVALTDRLTKFNIIVDAVSITNFEFSPQFNAAIENKVTNTQNALAAEAKLSQVKFEAQQRVAQAQGEAEAIQIQAQAIQTQGGAAYVQLQAIHQWDGKLPVVMGGNSVPFVNLGTLTGGVVASNFTATNITTQ